MTAIGRRAAGGLAAWLTLAGIAVVLAGLAWPVTAGARDGDRHGGCQSTSGRGHEAEPGEDCPGPTAAAAQPAAPAPAATPPPPTTTPRAPALLSPRPVPRPLAAPPGTDARPSLLAGAAVAALAALVVSGFRARRRLRQAWDPEGSDPAAP